MEGECMGDERQPEQAVRYKAIGRRNKEMVGYLKSVQANAFHTA